MPLEDDLDNLNLDQEQLVQEVVAEFENILEPDIIVPGDAGIEVEPQVEPGPQIESPDSLPQLRSKDTRVSSYCVER